MYLLNGKVIVIIGIYVIKVDDLVYISVYLNDLLFIKTKERELSG